MKGLARNTVRNTNFHGIPMSNFGCKSDKGEHKYMRVDEMRCTGPTPVSFSPINEFKGYTTNHSVAAAVSMGFPLRLP